MIESTLLSLVEKYLEVTTEITYEPLELHTRVLFRGKVAFSHTLPMAELETHLVDQTVERLKNEA
jgi:hypothetical protein